MFRRKLLTLLGQAGGHLWTVAPVATALVRPPRLSAWRPWSTVVDDPEVGPVRLSGALHLPVGRRSSPQASNAIIIAVHGLGGDIDSHYIRRAATCATDQGIACLRLNLRGADMDGDDHYHAGLTDDLAAAIASPDLARFERIFLLGYSIGGHLCLLYAAQNHDRRLRGVAAINPPLDLAIASRDIDSPLRWPYRHHVLTALKRSMAVVGKRRPLPISMSALWKINTCRQWDEQLIAPRFGFSGADDYYARTSVKRHLSKVSCRMLIVGSRFDPMVLPRCMDAARQKIRWLEKAGHVGFPSDVDLQQSAPLGLESQVTAWLCQNGLLRR